MVFTSGCTEPSTHCASFIVKKNTLRKKKKKTEAVKKSLNNTENFSE